VPPRRTPRQEPCCLQRQPSPCEHCPAPSSYAACTRQGERGDSTRRPKRLPCGSRKRYPAVMGARSAPVWRAFHWAPWRRRARALHARGAQRGFRRDATALLAAAPSKASRETGTVGAAGSLVRKRVAVTPAPLDPHPCLRRHKSHPAASVRGSAHLVCRIAPAQLENSHRDHRSRLPSRDTTPPRPSRTLEWGSQAGCSPANSVEGSNGSNSELTENSRLLLKEGGDGESARGSWHLVQQRGAGVLGDPQRSVVARRYWDRVAL